MNQKSDLTDVTVRVLLDDPTKGAILVTEDDTNEVWLPRSLVEYELNADGKTFTVTLPEWLAKKKGLI